MAKNLKIVGSNGYAARKTERPISLAQFLNQAGEVRLSVGQPSLRQSRVD